MKEKYSVKLKDIVAEQGLEVVHASKDYGEAKVYTADVNRPALQLAGFYDYFDPKRIQAMGRVESTYLESLPADKRLNALEEFMKLEISALIVCHGMQPLPECVDMAEKYDRNLFSTEEDTSTFMADLISSLRSSLAPRTTLHGVLVEIYGEGLLITGDSGIGKSETALELIKRGHRLIADDAVEIRRVSRGRIVGTAPELIRYYMELRGIGVIDVRHIYGIGSVKPESNIDMVVNFEQWNDEKAYDRLGLNTEYTELLGVKVPCATIPVRPGRNLAVILELAAMNNRQKNLGYNAAQTLADNHDHMIDAAAEK
ncbi:MAG: HPr(Ser) kinase/phosphatase [Clostridia bacterium]|nr:HPr(Ser) kinase/phosphatase [Clostridia bacterium]